MRQAFIVTGKIAKASRPGRAPFYDLGIGKQDETLLGLVKFNDDEFNGMIGCHLLMSILPIALVDKGDLDSIAGDCLDLLGQLINLCPFLLIGCRHMQCQQVAKRINGDMHLATIFALGAVEASAGYLLGATFRGGLERAAIPNHR